MKQNEIKILLEGLKYFYPTYFGEEPHKIGNTFKYDGKEYAKSWIISETFRIAEIPENGSDLGTAIRKLEGIYTSLESGAPAGSMPSKETIGEESQQKVAEGLKTVEQINKESKEAVERAIKTKNELYAKAKIEEAKLTQEEQKAAEVVIEEAKKAKTPEEAIKVVEPIIRERVPEDIPDEAVTFTAVAIVANARTDYAPAKEMAFTETLTKKPEYADIGAIYADSSKSLAEVRELTQGVAKIAFGEGQKTLLPDFTIEDFSDTPSTGFTPLPIPVIYRTGEATETKTQVMVFGESWVQRQLAGIGEGNIQGTDFNPSRLQSSFSAFRPLTGAAKNIAVSQVKKFATKAATKALVGGAAAVTAPETLGLSFVIGKILEAGVNTLSRLQRWLKENNLEELLPAFLGSIAIGVPFGFGAGATAFAGIFGGLKAFNSTPAGRASFGRGVGSFFGSLAGATLGAIGGPILFILLGFPVIVALILFIINSGAYVVPPGSSVGTVNIACNTPSSGKEAISAPADPAANAAVCIVQYLIQFHLNPLKPNLIGSAGWKNLTNVLNEPALQALAASAPVDGHLQCIGFVSATAGLAYGKNFGNVTDACFYQKSNYVPPGYSYTSGSRGIKSGDIFIMDLPQGVCDLGHPGHIGVVVSVDGALISCADANHLGDGVARVAHGCFALSQLTGYLRKR